MWPLASAVFTVLPPNRVKKNELKCTTQHQSQQHQTLLTQGRATGGGKRKRRQGRRVPITTQQDDEQGTPAAVPSLDGSTLQDVEDRTHLRLSQLTNEKMGFMQPTTFHLGGKTTQSIGYVNCFRWWCLLESRTCTTTARVTIAEQEKP